MSQASFDTFGFDFQLFLTCQLSLFINNAKIYRPNIYILKETKIKYNKSKIHNIGHITYPYTRRTNEQLTLLNQWHLLVAPPPFPTGHDAPLTPQAWPSSLHCLSSVYPSHVYDG